MGMHVVMTGNPVDGFTIIGPFATAEEACEWADGGNVEGDWWIAPLASPDSDA